MFTNPRRQRHLKRKIAVYVLLLGILGCAIFLLSIFFISRKPLFISPIGKENLSLANVEEMLKKNNILFSGLSVADYSYTVEITNGGQVRFSLDKDIDKQITSLQRILNQLTIEGKSFKSIDFRFSEPIISY